MKKTNTYLMALLGLAMMAASCSTEEYGVNESLSGKQTMTFTASQESGMQTRTAIGTDSRSIDWSASDAITVWDGSAKNEFTATPDASDATKASITGTVTSGSSSFTAVYPNSVGQNCTFGSDGITGLVIPATQTATAGTFDPAAGIMTASTTTSDLPFKNVCSYLKIPATADYTKIEVSVTSGNIAGTFSVNPSTGAITATTSGTQTVTLSGTIAKDGNYYIAIAPGEVEGFTVKCYVSDTHYWSKTKSGSYTFARAEVNTLSAQNNTNEWTETGGGPEYVTITGADGTSTMKWATKNVGATTVADSPETAYGDYYAWGATETWYSKVTWSGDTPTFTWKDGYTDGYSSNHKPTVAGNTLSATEDIATITYPGWRMPTTVEFQWLSDACDDGSYIKEITTSDNIPTAKGIYFIDARDATYKVAGTLFIDSKGASVFFPAAGNCAKTEFNYGGSEGYYWSSILCKTILPYSTRFSLTSILPSYNKTISYQGLTVRPISE